MRPQSTASSGQIETWLPVGRTRAAKGIGGPRRRSSLSGRTHIRRNLLVFGARYHKRWRQ